MIDIIKRFLHIQKANNNLSFEDKMNDMYDSLKTDELSILIGEDLVPFGVDLYDKIWELREQIKNLTGVIIPAVRVRDDITLQENEFEIYIRNKKVLTSYSVPNEKYAVKDIIYNLENIIKENIEEIISSSMIENYVNFVQKENSWLVWSISCHLNSIQIRKILVELVLQNKSIEDINFVFEKMGEYAELRDCNRIAKIISPLLENFNWEIQKPKISSQYKF